MGSSWLPQWKGGSAPLPLIPTPTHSCCHMKDVAFNLIRCCLPFFLLLQIIWRTLVVRSVMQRMLYVYYYEKSQSYRFCCVVYLFDCVCYSQNRITKGLVMSWSFNVLEDRCTCCILTLVLFSLGCLDTWLVWLLL